MMATDLPVMMATDKINEANYRAKWVKPFVPIWDSWDHEPDDGEVAQQVQSSGPPVQQASEDNTRTNDGGPPSPSGLPRAKQLVEPPWKTSAKGSVGGVVAAPPTQQVQPHKGGFALSKDDPPPPPMPPRSYGSAPVKGCATEGCLNVAAWECDWQCCAKHCKTLGTTCKRHNSEWAKWVNGVNRNKRGNRTAGGYNKSFPDRIS